MSLFGEMIDKVKERSDKGIVVGLIPRMHLGGEAHSKAIGVNKRLEGLCRSKNVRFIDPWDAFKGQRALFNADGIHLNDAGAKKLAKLIETRLPKSLVITGKQPTQEKTEMPKEVTQKVVNKYPARSDASGSTTREQTRTPPPPSSRSASRERRRESAPRDPQSGDQSKRNETSGNPTGEQTSTPTPPPHSRSASRGRREESAPLNPQRGEQDKRSKRASSLPLQDGRDDTSPPSGNESKSAEPTTQ
jgi:hypothetical protein